MHLQTRIELSEYRKALKAGCQAVHTMSHAAHKDGMSHLYTAARLLDKRCLSVTHKANSQLRAMGSNDDWLAHQYHMDHNPFQPATRKHVAKSGDKLFNETVDLTPEVLKNEIGRTGREVTTAKPVKTKRPWWPTFMDHEYKKYAENLRLEGEVCPSTDIFKNRDAETMADLNCTILMFPETYDPSSVYYQPLFLGSLDRTLYRATGNLDLLREVYYSHDPIDREERQALLGMAAGAMFGAAVDKVLGWFGYSTTTNKDIRHINSNSRHIVDVGKAVNATQQFSKRILATAHDLAHKEEITAAFIQMETAVQGLLDEYGTLMSGLAVLFHDRQLSPLVIDQDKVMTQVMELRRVAHERQELLLIKPQDVWHCPISYMVTRHLDVWVMIHIPVGRSDSRKVLYKYVETPLALTPKGTHFLAHPDEPYVSVSPDGVNALSIPQDTVEACKQIQGGLRYCPNHGFDVTKEAVVCSTALYAGKSEETLKLCPVSLLNEEFVHVASLGYGSYSFYSRDEVMVRVICSGGKNETSRNLKGLWKITLRPDCRVKGNDFFMAPSIDLWDESEHTDEIPLSFSDDMAGALNWGKNQGLLAGNPDGIKLSIVDVERKWNTTMLQERGANKGLMILGLIVAAVFGVCLLYCCGRECWGIYKRRQLASTIASAIDARFTRRDGEEQVEMSLMNPSAPGMAAVPPSHAVNPPAIAPVPSIYPTGYAPPSLPGVKR